MADVIDGGAAASEAGALRRVADLLGGDAVFRRAPQSGLEAHEILLGGLPAMALNHLVDNLVVMRKTSSLERAVGMSLRTFQRRKDSPAKPLNQEQSGRTWKFAEILARTTALLGSQKEAELWLEQSAIGLNQHRPIDLLATPAGVDLVETYLTRLEYGVYV